MTASGLDALRIPRDAEPEPRPRRRRQPYALVAFSLPGIAALAIAATAAYQRTFGRPPAVETLLVTAGRGAQAGIVLTGSGYVITQHKYITIGTKIQGQIVAEPIEEGQRVHRGDLLAQIDDTDYQAQLRQAIAVRDLAAANVRLAMAKVARRRELDATHAIAKEVLDTSENEAAVADATLRRDAAAVDYARFQVSQCRIVSPIDGVVLQKYREVGATINYSGQGQGQTSTGATDIAQLADTRDMRAEVDVNESDIAKLSLGMPAVVVPDAYPGERFDAMLVKIYPEADRQKATVKVEVQIHQPDLRIIKPELSVKTNFLERPTAHDDGPRLIVPTNAIVHSPEGPYVWTVANGIAHRVAIATVRDGDLVIVAPPANLREGQLVRARPS